MFLIVVSGGVEGEGGSSGEEWIMRGDLTKKKRKVVFGDGSDFKTPGWEEELLDFKRKLRMPQKLIQVSKPSSLTNMSSPAGSLSGGEKPNPSPHVISSLATTTTTSDSTPTKARTAASAKENKVPAKKVPPTITTPAKSTPTKETESPVSVKGKGSKGRVPAAAAPSPRGKKGKISAPPLPPPPSLSESESPLDEPTIERAVERMKAATHTANAKLAQKKNKNKTKPVLSKANSVPRPAKKMKGKNSSSLDELPVLSPQTTLPESDEPESEGKIEGIEPDKVAATPPPVKKGIRRNKFKSGFDYIRKKKKPTPTNPDGSAIPPTPRKVKVSIESHYISLKSFIYLL